MPNTQYSHYLESKVLTASPQRLHLMLIEGAQRFGRQAEEALRNGDIDAASAPLVHLLDILGELLTGARANKTELNRRISDLYWFLFRRVSLAKIYGDVGVLAEVLQLLEYERQTWQQVCDKLDAQPARAAGQVVRLPRTHLSSSSTTGFTLEA